jgi:hypothetical protein
MPNMKRRILAVLGACLVLPAIARAEPAAPGEPRKDDEHWQRVYGERRSKELDKVSVVTLRITPIPADDKTLAGLALTLSNAMRDELTSYVPGIRRITMEELIGRLNDAERAECLKTDCAAIATRKTGAQYALTGRLRIVGSGYSLDVFRRDGKGGEPASATAEGSGGEIQGALPGKIEQVFQSVRESANNAAQAEAEADLAKRHDAWRSDQESLSNRGFRRTLGDWLMVGSVPFGVATGILMAAGHSNANDIKTGHYDSAAEVISKSNKVKTLNAITWGAGAAFGGLFLVGAAIRLLNPETVEERRVRGEVVVVPTGNGFAAMVDF